MNILNITSYTSSEIADIPNYSQLCIIHDNLDAVENKTEILNIVLNKLRNGGELIFSFIDLDQVLDEYNKNTITKQQLCDVISNIKHYTNYVELGNYISSLEPNISLYKHMRENYQIIMSLVRRQY